MTQKEKDAQRDKKKEEEEKKRKAKAAQKTARKQQTSTSDRVRGVTVKEKKAANKPARKKTVAKANVQAKTPQRIIRKTGQTPPPRIQSSGHDPTGDRLVNVTKDTPKERQERKSLEDRLRTIIHDYKTERVYKDAPYDRSKIAQERPVGGPSPMIDPQVGPVGQLRSQAAHTYGYTPEAYKNLRQVPITLAPADAITAEQGVAGATSYDPPGIYIRSGGDQLRNGAPATLAHEQGHSWWYNRNMDTPANTQNFMNTLDRWATPEQLPSGQTRVAANPAGAARADWDRQKGLYDKNWASADATGPTELYARTVEFAPGTDHSNIPDYARPYYKGLLRGTNTLSTGQPTPDLQLYPERNAVDPWSLETGQGQGFTYQQPRTWDKRGW